MDEQQARIRSRQNAWNVLHHRSFAAGVELYKQHVARYPADAAAAYMQIGNAVFNRTHSFTRSEPWYLKALAINPDHEGALNTLANHYRGTPQGADYEQCHVAALRKHGWIGPADCDDVRGWDDYWSLNFRNALKLREFGYDTSSLLIRKLRQRGCRTVLCVGNGIHLEPRAFACAGLTVTALDLSPRATEFAAAFDFTVAQLLRFDYFVQLDADDVLLSQLLRAAPPVTYSAGSLFDAALCPGPYDAIVTRRTLQLFDGQQTLAAAARLLARLAPNGLLVNHSHNGQRFQRELHSYLTAQGVWIAAYDALVNPAAALPPERQVFVRIRSSG